MEEKMIQTTVYLSDSQYQALRKLVFERHETQALHIRQAIDWYLSHEIYKEFEGEKLQE